jgi:hypothetical protein
LNRESAAKEKENENHGSPKERLRIPDKGKNGDDIVREGIMLSAGENSEHDSYKGGKDNRTEGEDQGVQEPFYNDGGNRCVKNSGASQIPFETITYVN